MTDDYRTQVIKPGEKASKMGYNVCLESFGNCQAIEVVLDNRLEWQKEVGVVFKPHINLLMNEMVETKGGLKPVMWMLPTSDGGGHKPEIAGAIGTKKAFLRLGRDLIVMQDHDILRRGGKPCYCTNFFDAKMITSENIHLLEAYFEGLGLALSEAQIANLTGESAVVRHAVTAFCDRNLDKQLLMNVAGTCIGLSHVEKYLDGSGIRPGMPIYGLPEKGGRCNGFTRLIDIVLAYYGQDFYKNTEAMKMLDLLSVSSVSYSKAIQRIHGWNPDGSIKKSLAEIVGMYHITGGGIWDKLRLPPGIGAILNNMPHPPDVIADMQDISWSIPRLRITDWQAHGTLNGGLGYVAILKDEDEGEKFAIECKKDKIDAQKIGKTTDSEQGEIIIAKSLFREGKELSSLRPE